MVLKTHARWIAGWTLILLGTFGPPVPAQEPRPRVAVLELLPEGATKSEAAAASDRLRSELVRLRVFAVLDRSQTETILGELAFQQEGITDPSEAVAMGQMLSVEYIIAGRLIGLEGGYQIHAQMIDVATGEVMRSETAAYRGELMGLLAGQVPQVAARLAQVEPSPPPGPAPAREPPPPATAVPRSGWAGMGMMGSGGRTWTLMMGGMMLVAAAVMSSRDDGDRGGGYNTEAAVAMGVIGIGLLTYSLWPSETPSAASRPRQDAWPVQFSPLAARKRPGAGLAFGWRWSW